MNIIRCHTVVEGWMISRIKEESTSNSLFEIKAFQKFQKSGDLSTCGNINTNRPYI